jgi:hydroxymethylpyrimidine/phosphomethylpyrimidine kinase
MLPNPPQSPPIALSIAGSDNSAGAGVQADLKTFSACQVYGLTVVTCVVAEVPGFVGAIQPVDAATVRQQIELLARNFPIRAVKTGLLHSKEIIRLVADLYVDGLAPKNRPALVVDPVMVASSGDALLPDDAVATYRERLFPHAALITPNLDEAAKLLGRDIPDAAAMAVAGRELADLHGVPFLMKGGHLEGDTAVDLLVFPGGMTHEFSAPFLRSRATHGTGCTYSAAITAGLAQGHPMVEAVRRAKVFVSAAIRNSFQWRKPGSLEMDALNHFLLPE